MLSAGLERDSFQSKHEMSRRRDLRINLQNNPAKRSFGGFGNLNLHF
jgi:hypothetical protein